MLSAYGQERLVEIVAFYELSPFFHAVWGLDNSYGEGKVERGRRCMAEMEWDPADILYVGDTLHDGEVAQAMGGRMRARFAWASESSPTVPDRTYRS